MVDLEMAKAIALDYAHKEIGSRCILNAGTELTDSWVFSFATAEKVFIPGPSLRIFKEDGHYSSVSALDDAAYAKEYKNKKVAKFVVTEGCHW